MSNRDGGARGPVDLTEESYARASDYAKPEHTYVHDRGSLPMELLQDAVVVLLNVTLLGMGLVFLYRVWTEIVAFGDLQDGLSNIIFVVITIELYRLSVHYLKYRRVALNILVEVGVSAIIQKVILVGVEAFTMQQMIGISLILATLGGILWVHMRESRYGRPLTFPDAKVGARFAMQEGREASDAGPPRNQRATG